MILNKNTGKWLVLSAVAGLWAMAHFSCSPQRGVSYSEAMSETAMRLWPDSFQLSTPDKPVKWSYDLGVILKGVEEVWRSTGEEKWFAYIQKMMDFYVQQDGSIRRYDPAEYNIDHINNGKVLLFLYAETGAEKYRKAVQLLRSQLLTHPRTLEGGFWHKQIYPHQMWLDGLYMAQPFYAAYAQAFGEDSIYNDVVRQFSLMEKYARDSITGLLYHAWDESREQAWADKSTGKSPHVWGRAYGWYGMALVDALDFFPDGHGGKDSLRNILNRWAVAALAAQDSASGLWFDIMDMPQRDRNYIESSACAMMVYTLLKGIRKGYLDGGMADAAVRGYTGILERFVSQDDAGGYHFEGTVKVSGLGGKPYRDGSFAYYMSEPVIRDDPKGIGAFIKCAAEMEKRMTDDK